MNERATSLQFLPYWRAAGWWLLAVVTWLSLTPEPPSVPTFLGWDKGQHFAAYAFLTYWFGMTYSPHWRWPALMLAWGLAMEVIQGLGELRTMDPFDMVANAVGVAGGVLLLRTCCVRLLDLLEAHLPLSTRRI